ERRAPVDHDLISLSLEDPSHPVVTGVSHGLGTTQTAMAFSPTTARLLMTNMEAKNTTRLETSLRGRFMTHELLLLGLPDDTGAYGELIRRDLHEAIPGYDDASAVNDAAQAGSLANPIDIVADPIRPLAYVAALGTDRIATVRADDGSVVAITDVGRGPRGLAVDPMGTRLYCFNRTDLSISVLNLDSDQPGLLSERRMMSPEHRRVREGRDTIVSAKRSNNFSSSCAMCHIDGGFDGLAWDLGDENGTQMLPSPAGLASALNHPLKGPMVTQSLRGLKDHEPFHWRGDRPSLEDFAPTFDALLGGETLPPPETAAMNAYVKSLVYPPNPFYNRTNKPANPNIGAGLALFGTSCVGCHELAHDGASRPIGGSLDFGTDISFLASQVMEFTQLRGLYKKFHQERYSGFGILHDGRQGMGPLNDPFAHLAMGAFFGALALDGCPGNHAQDEASQLSHFMRAFPSNVMPVVGWQELVSGDAAPEAIATVHSRIITMAAQHAMTPSRCDVVARGLVAGAARGYVMLTPQPGPLNAGTLMFADEAGSVQSLQSLTDSLAPDDRLVFLATPPGSGNRIGIDLDDDGCPNFMDPFPEISADWNSDHAVDGDDVIAFFAEWDAGDADFNDDGSTDGDDVIAFFTLWDLGC
ncbi:MAG: hypothetical protein ACOYN0_18025, partial [Phycisphaerales bacterium]